MSLDGRMVDALDFAFKARMEIAAADVEPDPIEQRRACARAAGYFRKAADELDDRGRLDP